jgi:glucokinase
MNEMKKHYIGIDIGGTKCAVTLGDADGNILLKERFLTESPDVTVVRILDAARTLMARSDAPVLSAGISCGGPLDPVRGVILSPPNLPGWDHIEIVRAVEDALGIPAVLCNDANACALAEWRFGAGRGTKNMVFLTFGTGMGAGIILGGKIVNGANGNAGEIGHIRMQPYGPIGYGKMGSFEGFVSGGGIAMLARSLATERLQQGNTTAYCSSYAELERIDAKAVADAARQGDETANAVYRITGEMLGRGLSILVDLLNPERIVIGSIFGRAEELLRPHMERVMREECLPMSYGAVSVVPAGLGEAIGDLAALALAMSMNEG